MEARARRNGAAARFGIRRILMLVALVSVGLPVVDHSGASAEEDTESASITVEKTVTEVELTPTLSLDFGVDRAEAIPGDPLAYSATLAHTGASLRLRGELTMRNTGEGTATLASFFDVVSTSPCNEDDDGVCGFAPLAGVAGTLPGYSPRLSPTSSSGLVLELSAHEASGVTYPDGGKALLGTTVDKGATAAFTYEATVALSPGQLTTMADAALVARVANTFHAEATPRSCMERDVDDTPDDGGDDGDESGDCDDDDDTCSPDSDSDDNDNDDDSSDAGEDGEGDGDDEGDDCDSVDISVAWVQARGGAALRDVVATITNPDGTPTRYDAQNIPELAEILPGSQVPLRQDFSVHPIASRGSTESDAEYAGRLQEADGTQLRAQATAQASGIAALDPRIATTSLHLPVVTLAKTCRPRTPPAHGPPPG